jgi:tetratricopeptide (TPR) repeat protein
MCLKSDNHDKVKNAMDKLQQIVAKEEHQAKRKQVIITISSISIIVMTVGTSLVWSGWSNREHLKAVDNYLSEEKFDKARQELAKCGWFLVTGKDELTRKIDNTQYNWLLQHVDYLSKNEQYSKAVEALNKAIEIKNNRTELKPLLDAMIAKAAIEEQRQKEESSIIKKGWVTSRRAGHDIQWDDPPYKYILNHETGGSNVGNNDHSSVSLYERLPNGNLRGLNRSDGRFICAKDGHGGWYLGRLSFDDAPLGIMQSVEVKSDNGRMYELRVRWTKLNRDSVGDLESAEFYYEIRHK